MDVSYKTDLFDTQSSIRDLEDVMADIQNGTVKSVVEKIRIEDKESIVRDTLKKTLPAFFVGAVLNDNQPSLSKSKNYESTGIVQFDIDDYDVEVSKKLLQKINKISSLVYSFLSPSGGVKFGVLTDFKCADDTINHRYNIVYKMVNDDMSGVLDGAKVDSSSHSVSQQCLLSYDPNTYFNSSPQKIILNEKVNHQYQKEEKEEKVREEKSASIDTSNTTDEEVITALGFIPKDFSYNERLPINFAVIDHFGFGAKSHLLSHWNKKDKKKLGRQIDSQIKSHQTRIGKKSTLGTLFYESNKYGYVKEILQSSPHPTFHHDKYYTPIESYERLKKLITEDFFQDKKDKLLIVECGSGKTRNMYRVVSEFLNRNPRVRVSIFLKTHEMIEQFVKDMNADISNLNDEYQDTLDNSGKKVSNRFREKYSFQNRPHTIKGQGKLCHLIITNNPIGDGVSGITEKNIHERGGTNLCSDCFWRQADTCAYYQQFEEEFGLIGNVRVYTHNRLFQRPKSDINFTPDYVIIDEDIIPMIVDTEELLTIEKSNYSSIQDVLISVASGKSLQESVSSKCNDLSNDKGVVNRAITELRKQIAKCKVSSLKSSHNKLSNYKKLQETLNKRKKEQSLFEELILMSIGVKQQSKNVWIQHRDNEPPRLTYGEKKSILPEYTNTPMLYLDASGEEVIIDTLLERTFEVEYLRVNQQENAKVYQFYNHSFSKGSFLADSSKIDLISKWMDTLPTTKCGLIRYKRIKGNEKFLQKLDDKINDINGDKRGDEKCIGWFGNIRGINRFESCDTLLVIGGHRLPDYEIFNLSQLIFRQDIFDTKTQEDVEDYQKYLKKEVTEKVFRMKDGNHQSVKLEDYKTPECYLTSNHFDKAETYQAIHRLRLIHGNDNKQVFIFSNTPIDISVDELIDYHKELGEKHLSVINHIKKNGFLIDTDDEFINEFKWGKSEVSNFRKTRRSGGWLKNHRSLHYWGYETKNRRKGKVYSWMDKTDQDVGDYLNNKVGEIKSVSVCV